MARKFLSSPASLVVQAPAALGNGSDAGILAGDLWTPGRDAAGTVNESSWALVPKGRWVTVAGTRLDSLDATVKAAIPGWEDPGSQKWVGVTDAWNGVAVDPANCRAWWVCAGGHADSANNGIYRFEGLKMRYEVECLPSDTTKWSDGYRRLQTTGTFTSCPESVAQYNQKVQAGTWSPVNDTLYDELFWDQRPTSRHVYSGAVYLPSTNELVLASRRLWRYSIAAGKWTYRRVGGDNVANNLGEELIAYQDVANGQIMIGACGSGGPYGNTFDIQTNQWTGYSPPWASWSWNGAADTQFGETATIFRAPEKVSGSPSNTSPGIYMRVNLRTRATSAAAVAFEPGLSQDDFSRQDYYYDGPGMVYVPPLDSYWVLTRTVLGALGWFELDPKTTPWTLRRMTQPGAVPALTNGNLNVRRRMIWMPSLSAVAFLGSADQNITVYKL